MISAAASPWVEWAEEQSPILLTSTSPQSLLSYLTWSPQRTSHPPEPLCCTLLTFLNTSPTLHTNCSSWASRRE